MNDTLSDSDPNPDSISDSSQAHVDAGGDVVLISVAVRELCNRLRENVRCSTFEPSYCMISRSCEAEYIAVFRALKENTSVKHIEFSTLFERHHNERSALITAEYVESSNTLETLAALVTAEYVESSKTLQTLDLRSGRYRYSHGGQYSQEGHEMISVVLRALSRNTSVTTLSIETNVLKFSSVAFQELLTCTQTLQTLEIDGNGSEVFNEVQIAAIASGFANNTTLRDLTLQDWREADLTLVLAALQGHPALQKIRIRQPYLTAISAEIPSSSGLEALLHNQDSKVNELALEKVRYSTVGFRRLMQELERNTAITDLSIRDSVLSRESVQQVKSMLRHNTTLQSLNLTSSALKSAGLVEITPVLYRNTSIKALDLSSNDLDDIDSANLLRELLRRNKTITSLRIAYNVFGRNAVAVRSIADGVRSNTALQQLDLTACEMDDQGLSLLANALAIRNASILELNLHNNRITSVGVHALVDDNVEAVKTLTNLRLAFNPVKSEGATILAAALGRNAMPDLTQLNLTSCGIHDDGFMALVSALEQNTTLNILGLRYNTFGEQAFMSLADSLPNIKGLQQITIAASAGLLLTLPLLMEGFRKNTSLVEVDIDEDRWCVQTDCIQELKFLGYRNRFTPLLKASSSPGASPWLGIWSRALAKVTTEPDVLFHILRNKPKLVGSVCGLKKRKRDGE
jgi:Ran GTPase-activating protein (RanGAP) involved in mRNA processing and transport